jgi:hypothetical protein
MQEKQQKYGPFDKEFKVNCRQQTWTYQQMVQFLDSLLVLKGKHIQFLPQIYIWNFRIVYLLIPIMIAISSFWNLGCKLQWCFHYHYGYHMFCAFTLGCVHMISLHVIMLSYWVVMLIFKKWQKWTLFMYQRHYAVKSTMITDEVTWGKFTDFWIFHTHILGVCQTSNMTDSYDSLPKDISLNS